MSRTYLQKRQAYDWSKFSNQAAQPIFDHGLSSVDDLQVYYPRVRDRADIGVLRCEKSGVIVLDRSDHMDLDHYSEQDGFSYWGGSHRGQVLERTRRDDMRRVEQFRYLLEGKRCLDVGSGAGGFLDHVLPLVQDIAAVEPQAGVRGELQKCGYKVYPSMEQVAHTGFDVVTVFHVLEHMTNHPWFAIAEIARVLKPGGTLVLTTPNVARLENIVALVEGRNLYDPFSKYGPYGRHNREYTRDELHRLLAHGGFEVEVSFTANVHEDHPASNVDWQALASAIARIPHRERDLGQYLFTRWRKVAAAKTLRPAWLYRSYAAEQLS